MLNSNRNASGNGKNNNKMSSSIEQQPDIGPEIPRITSELAAQAAIRAQQILRKQGSMEEQKHHQQKLQKSVPAIPARSNDSNRAPPPEIPPKRHSLKKIPDGLVTPSPPPPSRLPPPPLPQKSLNSVAAVSASAQNSPMANVKFKEKSIAGGGSGSGGGGGSSGSVSTSSSPSIEIMHRNSLNPFDMMSSGNVIAGGGVGGVTVNATTSSSPSLQFRTELKKPTALRLSPSEDFGSEDALRGIESGLRNMERAMQEQMNLRSMEAAAAAAATANSPFAMDFQTPLTTRGLASSSINQIRSGWERSLSADNDNVISHVGGNQMGATNNSVAGNLATSNHRQSFEEIKLRQNQQSINKRRAIRPQYLWFI